MRAVAAILVLSVAPAAAGVARLVTEQGFDAPVAGDDQVMMFVRRPAGVCPPPPVDAGVADAPLADAPPDAGISDAGTIDAGIIDAGVGDGGGGCGPSVMMIIQPRFDLSAGGQYFAFLTATPAEPAVRIEAQTVFAQISDLAYPITHEVTVDVPDPSLGTRCGGGGCGGGFGFGGGSSWAPPSLDGGFDDGSDLQTIGPYEVAHTQPASRDELAAWLDGFGYVYDQRDLDAIAPYIALGWFVEAIRVDATDPVFDALPPMSFVWSGEQIRVPLGLGRTTLSSSKQVTVFIASDGRYDLPGADISFAGPIAMGDASYVTRNELHFDSSQTADADPIAAHVAGDPPAREEVTVTSYVHVPVQQCPSSPPEHHEGCGCTQCDAGGGSNGVPYAVAFLLVVRPRRPRRRAS